jgi:hypothetical protein
VLLAVFHLHEMNSWRDAVDEVLVAAAEWGLAVADALGCDCDVVLEVWQHRDAVELRVAHDDWCARLVGAR